MSNTSSVVDWKHAAMRLQLSTAEPDSIGFSKVSGFYGPGTWAGWFLCICASWYTLVVHHGAGFDLNTWMYLLGMNWAAIDFLRHMHILLSLKQAGNVDWVRESASIGASFNMIFWGLVHACLQLLPCSAEVKNGSLKNLGAMQRGITLIVGTALPAAALSASPFLDAFGSDVALFHNIPALYWEGMPNHMKDVKTSRASYNYGHDHVTLIAGIFGMWMLCYYAFLLWAPFKETRSFEVIEAWVAYACFPIMWLGVKIRGKYRVASIIILYIAINVFLALRHAGWIWYLFPLWVPLLVLGCFLAPFGVVSQTAQFCFAYIVAAYFRVETTPSHGCFFMPCAPQSISETDQAFSLFAGLFSFIVVEVIVPLIRKSRKERQRQRLWEQDERRRFEMRSAGALRHHTTNFPTNETSATEASDAEIHPVRRINSGIRAEEGRAG